MIGQSAPNSSTGRQLALALGATPTGAPLGIDELTAREREILALLAQGLTDRGIGERLWLTPKTVATHIRHILASSTSQPGLITTAVSSPCWRINETVARQSRDPRP